MISACSARILSLFSGLRLLILLSNEITGEECLFWANKAIENPSLQVFKDKVGPITNALSDFGFAEQLIKTNMLNSAILAFTSSVEFYLQDIVVLCLQRNSSLRKQAFANYEISGKELEEFSSINDIKRKHFRLIASSQTSGALFSEKIKKAQKFLGVKGLMIDKQLLQSLDSLWELRNRLAHHNHGSIKEYSFLYKNTEQILPRPCARIEYQSFITPLCVMLEEAVEWLILFDKETLEKWTATDFIPRAERKL